MKQGVARETCQIETWGGWGGLAAGRAWEGTTMAKSLGGGGGGGGGNILYTTDFFSH